MGVAFAVIALTLVILIGTYYIVRTYSSGMVALQNYTESIANYQFEASQTTKPVGVLRYWVASNSLVGVGGCVSEFC